MNYPTMEEVLTADHEQLGKWARFLDSPGLPLIDGESEETFYERMRKDRAILEQILDRFDSMGGWTPFLSKRVGWDKPL